MTAVDILRTIAILAYGIFVGWIMYKMMKSADADEENEDKEELENDSKRNV